MIERLHRLVLRVLPREFRDQFGADLLATARAVDAERPRRRWQTIRAVSDAVTLPFALRAEMRVHLPADLAGMPRRRTVPMESLWRDLRFAARGLRREPGFTAFCCITLALGIGANAAMFGIADRLLLRGPDGIRDASLVVRIYGTEQPSGMREFTTSGFGYVTYDLLQRGSQIFDGLATYAVNAGVLGSGADAKPVEVGYASANLFSLLGAVPSRGRVFTEAEDATTGATRVAVLSDAAWRLWFGASDAALGQSIVIGDEPFAVIGVAPPHFNGPQFGRVDVWVPGSLLGSRVTKDWTTAWNAQWLQIVGRLKPGVSFEQAGADATAVRSRGYAGTDATTRAARLTVASLRAGDAGTDTTDFRILRWLTGVSAVVLLIACANIANLMLARGVRRGREVAIRAALGAGRLRLARLLLFEALLIALGGAALGLFVALPVGNAARRLMFTSVDWTHASVDPRVLGISALIAIATGVLIGLAPAIRSSRPRLTDALKTGVREGGGHRSRLRMGLTVAQAALSGVLLVGAGLFVRSLWHANTLDLGFDADRVAVVEVSRQNLQRVPAGPARDAERARRRSFYFDALDRVRTLPGVEHASVAVGLPFGNRFTVRLRVPGREIPKLPSGGPGVSAVAPDYFDTMGTPVRQGRAFTASDGAGTEPVAIVSRLMADTIWPNDDPIGQCIIVGDSPEGAPPPPCARIVGIAGNTFRSRLRENPVMHYYIPAGQEVGFGGASLLVRGAKGAEPPVAAVRKLLSGLDTSITYVQAETIRSRIEPQLQPWRLGATVFALAGVLALIVAGIGIYSVMSYLIADRRHEIGVRLALGASAGHILALVLRGSTVMAIIGVVIGEAIAASLGGVVGPLLFGTSPHDLVVFVSVGVVLVAVALGATIAPAARARRVSAVEALRAE